MRISDWSSDVCSSDLIAIIASHDTVTVLPEPLGPMTSICPKGSLFPGSDMSWNTKLYGLPVAVRKIVTGLGPQGEKAATLGLRHIARSGATLAARGLHGRGIVGSVGGRVGEGGGEQWK